MGSIEPRRTNVSNETISLQTELDSDWCLAITEAYSGQYEVVLEAGHFIAQRMRPNCHGRYMGNDYETVFLTADPEMPGEALHGVILGAKLVQELFEDEDGEDYYAFVPHAVMTDAVRLARHESEQPLRLTGPGEQILVPINPETDSLTLYPRSEAI